MEWRALLQGFWDPFNSTVQSTTSISVTAVINALNDLLADHFFPAQVGYLHS